MEEIVNRVQRSSLITLDLEDYYTPGERIFFDLKPFLFQELVLKEKDFRAQLKSIDWSNYQNKHVAIGCTADAIIPTWAYMLLATYLNPMAKTMIFGTLADLEEELFRVEIGKIDWEKFKGQRIVVKGCSKIDVPKSAYVQVVSKLQNLAASIMFGEACSTVPLFKQGQKPFGGGLEN